MASAPATLLETLERLAPGTPLRHALERIIQQGHGALVVLGNGPGVEAISSGGFQLDHAVFTPARLAELAKMDGGIVVGDEGDRILAANVHFLPDPSLPTDETGSRHRTAERLAAQTGKPVLAVSEDRRVATLFHSGEKIELAQPTSMVTRVNERLQTLERLKRRLGEAEQALTGAEVAGLGSYRTVVTTLQRAEIVRRVAGSVEREAVTLGEDGSLVGLQVADLMRGVDAMRELILRDYVRPRRPHLVREALDRLEELATAELDDLGLVGKVAGFPDLDEAAHPLGVRLVAAVGRVPESVQEELVRHFRDLQRLLEADVEQLERVAGVGVARAVMLRQHFDRLLDAVAHWAPELG